MCCCSCVFDLVEGVCITLEDKKEAIVLKRMGLYIIADANHPLAGCTLQYKVKVMAIREARKEELLKGFPIPEYNSCSGSPGCCIK